MANADIDYDRGLGYRVWRGTVGVMAKAHSHADIECNFLLKGSMSYMHGGQIYDLPLQRFAVFWGGVPHHLIHRLPGTETIWVTFPLAWFMQLKLPAEFQQALLRGEMQFGSAEESAQDQLMLTRWVEDFGTRKESFKSIILLEIEARLRRQAEACRAASPRATARGGAASGPGLDRHIDAALGFIHLNYADDIRAKDIAKAVGLHPKYLMYLFRRTCRMNLWDYVLRLRVSHAQRLLLTTSTKVAGVAFESGFQNVASFYSAFKKYTVLTPLQYRRKLTEGREGSG